MLSVELQVQLQNNYARFAEDAELPSRSVFGNERAQVRLADMPRTRHSRNLEFRGSRRNVRVQPGAR